MNTTEVTELLTIDTQNRKRRMGQVSPVKPITEAMIDYGKAKVKAALQTIDSASVSSSIQEYLGPLSTEQRIAFVGNWGLVVTGETTKSIECTLWDSWYSKLWLDSINFHFTGTPVPNLSWSELLKEIPEGLRSEYADDKVTTAIRQKFAGRKKISAFLESSSDIFVILPMRLLMAHFQPTNLWIDGLLRAGKIYNGCEEALRA